MSLMESAGLPVILSYRLPKINVSIFANNFLKERRSLGHAGGWFKVGGFFGKLWEHPGVFIDNATWLLRRQKRTQRSD